MVAALGVKEKVWDMERLRKDTTRLRVMNVFTILTVMIVSGVHTCHNLLNCPLYVLFIVCHIYS